MFTKEIAPVTNSNDHEVIVILMLIVYLRRRLLRTSSERALSRKDLSWLLKDKDIIFEFVFKPFNNFLSMHIIIHCKENHLNTYCKRYGYACIRCLPAN